MSWISRQMQRMMVNARHRRYRNKWSSPKLVIGLVLFTALLVYIGYLVARKYASTWDAFPFLDDPKSLDFIDYDHNFDIDKYRRRLRSRGNYKPPSKSHREEDMNKVNKHLSILNLTDFKYIYKTSCQSSTSEPKLPLLLLLIHSNKEQVSRRNLIRKTYGSVKEFKGWKIRIVFLIPVDPQRTSKYPKRLSKSLNLLMLLKLRQESNQFKDILVGDLSEDDRLQIYCSIMGYQWAKDCKPDFILKTHDNFLVDVYQIVDYISTPSKSSYNAITCKTEDLKAVNRKEVPKTVFLEDVYPPHCNPDGMIIPMGIANRLLLAAQGVWKYYPEFWWKEDAWISGVLRMKLFVKLKDIGSKFDDGEELLGKEEDRAVNGGGKITRNWMILKLSDRDRVMKKMESAWSDVKARNGQM